MAPRSWMDVFNLGMYDSENNVIFLNAGLSATNERSGINTRSTTRYPKCGRVCPRGNLNKIGKAGSILNQNMAP